MKDINKTKEKLIEELEQFRSLVESASDFIWEVDQNGTFTYVSPKIKDLLGYEPGEVIGKTPFDLMPPGEAERISATFMAIAEAKKPIEKLENVNIHKNGQRVVLETSGMPILDNDGELQGYRGIDRDITERKMAEKQIREAKDFLENIFKTSVDGIMVTDQHGCITMVNEATAKMLGYPKDEVIGKHTVELSFKGKNHEEQTKEFLSELFGKGIITGFEDSWLKKDGGLIDIDTNIALLRDEEGNVIGAVGSIRDITDHKRGEKELKETKNFLENVLENSWDPIIVTDNKGLITTVNKSFLHMLGYKSEEVIGKHTSMLAPAKKGKYESTLA